MPLLKVQTNIEIPPALQTSLLAQLSSTVAEALNKPERYVMVTLETVQSMMFAGSNQALAYLELKSLNLPEAETKTLSATLCSLLQQLDIQPDRVYIEFSNAQRHMWGWNNSTF